MSSVWALSHRVLCKFIMRSRAGWNWRWTMVVWPAWRKAGCDPSFIWAACYRSTVGSKGGAGNPWYSQDLRWNRKCIHSIQWLLGHLWYSRAIKIYSIYEEEGEESRTKENRPLHFEMFPPWCCLPFWWWWGPTSATGWLLIFSRGFSPEERLPLHFMRGNTGSGEAGVRMKQKARAILREEELFHHNPSPHQLRWQKDPFSHNALLKTPSNHLFMFLSTDFAHHLF